MHVYISLFPPLTVLDCPALTLQSSRSLDALSDLKLQQLEAELEGARHEAQGACQREEELKGECERLKEEMRMLQNSQRDRVSVGARRVGNLTSTLPTPFVQAVISWKCVDVAVVYTHKHDTQHNIPGLVSTKAALCPSVLLKHVSGFLTCQILSNIPPAPAC